MTCDCQTEPEPMDATRAIEILHEVAPHDLSVTGQQAVDVVTAHVDDLRDTIDQFRQHLTALDERNLALLAERDSLRHGLRRMRNHLAVITGATSDATRALDDLWEE